MTILKAMFIIAIGTYAAYEFGIRRKLGRSAHNNTSKLPASNGRVPAM